MDGSINFNGTLSGSIAGGGGGSEVTITPTLQTGTKIADYSIDSENGSLYAPTPETVTITPSLIDGQKVADFTIGEHIDSIYIPDFTMIESIEEAYEPQTGDIMLFRYTSNKSGVVKAIYCPAAGSGGGVNYSYNEQDTGITWVDGRHIYQKSFLLDTAWQLTTSLKEFPFDITDLNIDVPVGCEIYFNGNRGPVPCKEIRKLANRTFLQISGVVQYNLDAGSIFTVRYIKNVTL